MNKFLNKIKIEKISIILIVFIFLVIIVFLYFLFRETTQELKLVSPNQGSKWQVGESQTIKWQSKNIDKVGIVLFKGEDPTWIAQGVDADLGEYQWEISYGQDYGPNYRIAIFEYPWSEKSLIDYSTRAFSIIASDFFTCEQGSIKREWLYVPADFPGLRKFFVTPVNYRGNLGGIEGADEICQAQAQKMELEGEWMAFLGGEKRRETALERLKNSKKGLGGFFVEALPGFSLERESDCYRFVAKNLEEFLNIFSGSKEIYSHKLNSDLLEKIDKIWLGRIRPESKQSCVFLSEISKRRSLKEKYSFSSTCQSWTRSDSYAQGYEEEENREFPECFTPEGEKIEAVRIGGLGSGLQGNNFVSQKGKTCDTKQALLCIEY